MDYPGNYITCHGLARVFFTNEMWEGIGGLNFLVKNIIIYSKHCVCQFLSVNQAILRPASFNLKSTEHLRYLILPNYVVLGYSLGRNKMRNTTTPPFPPEQ